MSMSRSLRRDAIVISNGFIIVVAAADLACNKFQDDAAITAEQQQHQRTDKIALSVDANAQEEINL